MSDILCLLTLCKLQYVNLLVCELIQYLIGSKYCVQIRIDFFLLFLQVLHLQYSTDYTIGSHS